MNPTNLLPDHPGSVPGETPTATTPPRTRGWRQQSLPWLLAAVVVAIGLGITVDGTRRELNKAAHTDAQRFDRLADRVKSEVVRRVTVYRYGLGGARSLFPASNLVERHEFLAMVESRDLPSEFPGSLGIGYIHRVPADPEGFEAFLTAARADGAPDFEVTIPPGSEPMPGARINDRMIIQYIMPLDDNRSARGLDIGAHPVRREAAERAMVTGEGAITGRIELVQDDQKVAGFLYLLPVYEKDAETRTEAQRIDALRGWVYMPILGPAALEGTPEVADGEIEIEVYDGPEGDADLLIYATSDHDHHHAQAGHNGRTHDQPDLHQHAPIQIGGRTWAVSLIAGDRFVRASRSPAWVVAGTGTALTTLLVLLTLLLGSATRRAWAIAEGMTADIRRYADAANAATLAKSEFLANMSHEIRTPMAAIIGYSELMDQDPLTEAQRDHLATIKRNGDHLLSVINDILDLSKIEAGKLNVEVVPTRPNEVLLQVLSLMQAQAAGKNITLDAHFDTEVPEVIQSDPVRLRQILINLVGNAVKFTEIGGVNIAVRHEPKRSQLLFEVTDTGIGMSDEQLGRIFQSFEQADASTTRQYGGTGLGLMISQRLAEMLGGSIEADSVLHRGSCFCVAVATGNTEGVPMLPSGKPVVVNADAEDSATVQAHNSPLEGRRIVLAEDGIDNQRLIGFHLRKAGADVTVVNNGEELLEAMSHHGDADGLLLDPPPFDLVLSDMQMPVIDGYTAVARLRKKGCRLPIIALTAHAMAGDQQRCRNAGCDGYESKPIAKDKLINTCIDALQPPNTSARAA